MKLKGRCILHKGHVEKGGYGLKTFYDNGFMRAALVHREAWERAYGPIPEGLDVLHLCDVLYAPGDISYRRCVNADHLFLGDDYVNQQHSVALGRAADHKGEAHHLHKLTNEVIYLIRKIYVPYDRKYGAAALAKKYGVHRMTIERALRGESWTHL